MEYWMNTTLSRIHLTFDRSKLSGDRSDVKVIQEEMKVCVLHRERERESMCVCQSSLKYFLAVHTFLSPVQVI